MSYALSSTLTGRDEQRVLDALNSKLNELKLRPNKKLKDTQKFERQKFKVIKTFEPAKMIKLCIEYD